MDSKTVNIYFNIGISVAYPSSRSDSESQDKTHTESIHFDINDALSIPLPTDLILFFTAIVAPI
jgi:hypothetical protein